MTDAEVQLTKQAVSEVIHRVGLETLMDLIRTCAEKNALHLLPTRAEQLYAGVRREIETETTKILASMESARSNSP